MNIETSTLSGYHCEHSDQGDEHSFQCQKRMTGMGIFMGKEGRFRTLGFPPVEFDLEQVSRLGFEECQEAPCTGHNWVKGAGCSHL